MSIVDPIPESVKPPALHRYCREYLGQSLGYCDGAIQTHDAKGRGFCTEHAKERGF